ncbi:MAG: hypothetical protein KIT17_20970 [Rubrivivax sp.]|nr:hypothetical protein [Rubrivivax sp.]
MNVHRCQRIAERIGSLLEPTLGMGVDAQRMLADRLYRRDVLLVCDAHRGTELAELARWFRRSAAEAPSPDRLIRGTAVREAASTSRPAHLAHAAQEEPAAEALAVIDLDSGYPGSGFGSSTFDSQRDATGPLPSPADIVRQQLERQRAAARHGGWLANLRALGR